MGLAQESWCCHEHARFVVSNLFQCCAAAPAGRAKFQVVHDMVPGEGIGEQAAAGNLIAGDGASLPCGNQRWLVMGNPKNGIPSSMVEVL